MYVYHGYHDCCLLFQSAEHYPLLVQLLFLPVFLMQHINKHRYQLLFLLHVNIHVGIIKALQPNLEEMELAKVLHRSDNIVMHEKIESRINNAAIPILSAAIEEGVHEGVFHCDYIEERVRSILSISDQLLDRGNVSEAAVIVFVDIVEKTLGAPKGTMEFIKKIISYE